MLPSEPMQTVQNIDPVRMIRPKRKITGMSAVLLPFREDGEIDWDGFCDHVQRTADAGLLPAVNMDTGYVNLLDAATRGQVLELTRQTLGPRPFVAGAFVADGPGAAFDLDAYARQIEPICRLDGTPVIFPSWGLRGLPEEKVADAHARIGRLAERFIAFELGEMFVPFGRIYAPATYRRLMQVPECIGAKHSSLDRRREWERLAWRDQLRPDFLVLTGNDLAIDMVVYGSDYLLGLSTFAPELFARRDALWQAGDAGFYAINDVLQYLGFFCFRPPVPAYKHSAAQFLKLRGWIGCDRTHPGSPQRPPSDVEVLQPILERIEELLR
jgi:dihydrodipicolinate synthase/N-acetylneuraminate lyase